MDFTILGVTMAILKVIIATVLAILIVGIIVLVVAFVIAGVSVLFEKEGKKAKSLKDIYTELGKLCGNYYIVPTGYSAFYDYMSGAYTSKTFVITEMDEKGIGLFSPFYSNNISDWLSTTSGPVIIETDNAFIVCPFWNTVDCGYRQRGNETGLYVRNNSKHVIIAKDGDKNKDKEKLNKILEICDV